MIHLHVLKLLYWSVEIKVFDIDGHELGVRVRDDTINEKLYREEVDCWSAAVTWAGYEVSPNS